MYILNVSYRTWLCYASIIREHSSGQIMEKSSSKRRSFLHYPLSQRSWNQARTEYFLPGLPSSWIVDTMCHLFSTTGVKSKTEKKNQTNENFLTFRTICRGSCGYSWPVVSHLPLGHATLLQSGVTKTAAWETTGPANNLDSFMQQEKLIHFAINCDENGYKLSAKRFLGSLGGLFTNNDRFMVAFGCH